MQNELTITVKANYILVRSDGDKDLDFAEKLWTQVAATCEENDCFNVLGIARSSTPLEAMDGYDHARLFVDLHIDHRYRIAWVEFNSEASDMARFIETVLSNRGLPGRVFSNEEDARAWLLS